jgi:DNA-binding transcriptional regulator YiaG
MKEPLSDPTPNAIRETRQYAGLTLARACKLLHVHQDTWAKWESGARTMHPAFWELFLLKIGVVTLSPPDQSD